MEISLGVDVQGLLTLTPSSSWSTDGGNCCIELHEDEDGVVVFISGFYFSRKLFRSKLSHVRDQAKQRGKIFRRDSNEVQDTLSSQERETVERSIQYYPSADDDDLE